MVLIVDYRDGKGEMLLAGDGPARRFGSSGRRDGFVALGMVLAEVGDSVLDGVAAVLPTTERQQEAGMTWSSVRGAVALANALAFAHGVPAVRIDSADDDDVLAESADAAVVSAVPQATVRADYDGQPNITRPKDRGVSVERH
ncbi:hypothetical protein COY93_00995 [Candidatus Uhrbacteria bacterium CG_4_10_14_0_8_um_filter_58_22]|uniref:Uncharacterized protein n=1 Tax=Candidatus Uhrbacteria bacterium CG_4_10_14_0_8_um_filter_58_22 TaxID=1975029 RepID=A0A2M7QBT3_9BACT|nr:MAG: hypothetical protein AUJ19_03605 [Parcubacteria group bacterium CG1_02_58_44]PIY63243.1 MAG: hypothetical protein COY93_00995 [Candidatus Uhrbacteria bacterium CG_4_10_14_0_8_um_filter_58_22]